MVKWINKNVNLLYPKWNVNWKGEPANIIIIIIIITIIIVIPSSHHPAIPSSSPSSTTTIKSSSSSSSSSLTSIISSSSNPHNHHHHHSISRFGGQTHQNHDIPSIMTAYHRGFTRKEIKNDKQYTVLHPILHPIIHPSIHNYTHCDICLYISIMIFQGFILVEKAEGQMAKDQLRHIATMFLVDFNWQTFTCGAFGRNVRYLLCIYYSLHMRINRYGYVFVCMDICLYVCIYLSIYLSICLCTHVSICVCVYVCLLACLLACLLVCVFVCLFD